MIESELETAWRRRGVYAPQRGRAALAQALAHDLGWLAADPTRRHHLVLTEAGRDALRGQRRDRADRAGMVGPKRPRGRPRLALGTHFKRAPAGATQLRPGGETFTSPSGAKNVSGFHPPGRNPCNGETIVPERIQRSRIKGWRMPEGAIYVGRPTRLGNPYRIGLVACGCRSAGECNHNILRVETAEEALIGYRAWLEAWKPERLAEALAPLRGHNLICWCRLDQPCHADLLLELANV